MRWFKHDTDANQDAKLKRLRMKYGLEGYGLYWYCIELIAGAIDQHNLTFELEHDAEIIGFDTGIHQERVQEMMTYMVRVGLFENTRGVITCVKIARRLDQSMVSSAQMRSLIKQMHDKGVLAVEDESCQDHDPVMTESCQTRLDKTRLDEKTPEDSSESSVVRCPHGDIIDAWSEVMPDKQQVRKNMWKSSRKEYAWLSARWKEMATTPHSQTGEPLYTNREDGAAWWRAFFQHIRKSHFLMADQPWFNFGWVVNKTNFYKIIEGNYHQ